MSIRYEDFSDEELIERLHGGDGGVMDYLLEKYKPLVRKRCNMLYLIGGDSDDLLQEGMIGLFKAIRDYRGEKNTGFATFAQLCINRQLYTLMESSSRKKHQPLNTAISLSGENDPEENGLEEVLTGHSPDPEQLLLEQEKMLEFHAKLGSSLSRMEQQVLGLYMEGYNYLQVAEILGKPAKSIDNALQRVRSKIRTIIAEE